MPKTFYEAQVSEEGGMFFMTLTLTTGKSTWTSSRAQLHVATIEEARTEADRQMRALHKALEGGLEPDA